MAPISSLPLELIGMIIDSVDDTADLKALSIVSRAWFPLSQRRIFKESLIPLNISKVKQIRSAIFEPADTAGSLPRAFTLFPLVRNLSINGIGISLEEYATYLGVFRLFTDVASLSILSWDFREFESHDVADLLGHFSNTVTALNICCCWENSAVLIFLKSLFPHVIDLRVYVQELHELHTYKIQESDQRDGVEFRGKLTFEYLDVQHRGFLAFVDENCSDVHSITVENCESAWELQELFRGPQAHKLTSVSFGSYSDETFVSLVSCTQLRTLTIILSGGLIWNDMQWRILETITSPHLEEININFEDERRESQAKPEEVDDLLCGCYDRSWENGVSTFHVNLYPNPSDPDGTQDWYWLGKYVQKAWPRFLKKGIVNLPCEPWTVEDVSDECGDLTLTDPSE